jgi:hypothetical protein
MSQRTDKRCPPDGNTGLPITINGALSPELIKSITRTSNYVFQFAESRASPATLASSGLFDEMDTNTLLLDGNSYNCIGGQICSASQQISSLPGALNTVAGEICIWFARRGQPRETSVVIIPIYTTSDIQYITYPSIAQTYIQSMKGIGKYINITTEDGGATVNERKKPKSLQQLIDSFENTTAFSYVTCIDLKNGNSIVTNVLYFPASVNVHATWWNEWVNKTFETRDFNNNVVAGTLPVRRLPAALYSGTETASRYGIISNIKAPTVWSNIGLIDSGSISVNDTGFLNRFSFHRTGYKKYSEAASEKMKEDKSGAVSQYRCVRLNPDKDIVNGYVTIDPMTGSKKMDKVLEDQNADFTNEQLQMAAMEAQAAIQPGDIGRMVAIIVGLSAAVYVVGWIVWNIVKRFKADSFTAADAVGAAANAAAVAQPLLTSESGKQLIKQISEIKSAVPDLFKKSQNASAAPAAANQQAVNSSKQPAAANQKQPAANTK